MVENVGIIKYREPDINKERDINEEMKIHEQKLALMIKKRQEEQRQAIYDKRKLKDKIVEFEEVGNMDNLNLTFKDVYELSEENTITKTEIILKSPYRIYFEEEALTEDQIIFLFFFDLEGGHIGKSLKKMGISRHTLTKWQNYNAIFNEIVRDSKEYLIDTAEQTISKAIELGDVNAAKFVLETQGKNRGYGKHQTIQTEEAVVIGFDFINVNDNLPLLEAEITEKEE